MSGSLHKAVVMCLRLSRNRFLEDIFFIQAHFKFSYTIKSKKQSEYGNIYHIQHKQRYLNVIQAIKNPKVYCYEDIFLI